jgi:hypothetical protein
MTGLGVTVLAALMSDGFMLPVLYGLPGPFAFFIVHRWAADLRWKRVVPGEVPIWLNTLTGIFSSFASAGLVYSLISRFALDASRLPPLLAAA